MKKLFIAMRSSEGSLRRLTSNGNISLQVMQGDNTPPQSSKEVGSIFVYEKDGRVYFEASDSKGVPITNGIFD